MKKLLIFVFLIACGCGKSESFKTITVQSEIMLEIPQDFSPLSEKEFSSLEQILNQQDIFLSEKLLLGFINIEDESKLIISEIESNKFQSDFSKYKKQLLQQFQNHNVYFGERTNKDIDMKQIVIEGKWIVHRFFVICEDRIFKIDFINKDNKKILEKISYSIDSIKKN